MSAWDALPIIVGVLIGRMDHKKMWFWIALGTVVAFIIWEEQAKRNPDMPMHPLLAFKA